MISVVGKKNGRITVLKSENKKYLVKCDCGSQKTIDARNFYKTFSCGCLYKEVVGLASIKHGFRRGEKQKHPDPEYIAWGNMLGRCNNVNDTSYENYGGRGITVCSEWQQPEGKGFSVFLECVGKRPSKCHSLDRIDVNGNYEPTNVRWALPVTQARNKRNTRRINLNGEAKALIELSEETGINQATLESRLARGWAIKEVLTIEPDYRPKLNLNKGSKFGCLEVIGFAGKKGKTAHDYYQCKCICGNTEAIIRGSKLVAGEASWCSQQCLARKKHFKTLRAETKIVIPCTAKDCTKPAKARGYCFQHYSAAKRSGEFGSVVLDNSNNSQ